MKTRSCTRMSARFRRPATLWHWAWAGASAAMLAASPVVAQTSNPYPDKKVEGWEIHTAYPFGHDCFATIVFSDGLKMVASLESSGNFLISLGKKNWVTPKKRDTPIPMTFEFDSGTVSTTVAHISFIPPPSIGTIFFAEKAKQALAVWATSRKVRFVADGQSLGTYDIAGTRAASQELMRCVAAVRDAH